MRSAQLQRIWRDGTNIAPTSQPLTEQEETKERGLDGSGSSTRKSDGACVSAILSLLLLLVVLPLLLLTSTLFLLVPLLHVVQYCGCSTAFGVHQTCSHILSPHSTDVLHYMISPNPTLTSSIQAAEEERRRPQR